MNLYYHKENSGVPKSQKDKLEKYLNELPNGSYIITIEKNEIIGNPRGRYFSVLKIIATDTGNSTDDLHEEYKRMFNDGKSTGRFKSDSDWYKYINQVTMHGQTFHNANIPEGRDMNYQRWLEIEESYKKSFISG